MAPSIRYQILAAHGGSTLEQVGRIYEASIPPSERKPVEAIRAMAAHDEYRLVAALRDDTVLGFVALFAPPDETFALLEYLAMDKAARGAGIGAGLFRAAADAVASARRPLGLLLEVEADQAGDPADTEHRRRRLAFYRRLGCRRIAGLSYELPLRVSGTPPPMHLLAHGVPDGRPIRLPDLRRALGVIYAQVYDQSPSDPRIDRMLAAQSDPVILD